MRPKSQQPRARSADGRGIGGQKLGREGHRNNCGDLKGSTARAAGFLLTVRASLLFFLWSKVRPASNAQRTGVVRRREKANDVYRCHDPDASCSFLRRAEGRAQEGNG